MDGSDGCSASELSTPSNTRRGGEANLTKLAARQNIGLRRKELMIGLGFSELLKFFCQ
jgi:hypothetical protein